MEKLVNSLGVALPRDVRSNRAPATNQVKQTQKNMNILELKLKQEHFAEILSGEKKTETREIRPKNAHRYVEFFNPETGTVYPNSYAVPDDGPVDARCIKYDAIRFHVGSAMDRPNALVKVENAQYFIITDDEGKEIIYTINGREYVAAEIDYTLGDIIESYV